MLQEKQENLISRYDDPDLTGPERQELDALLAGEPEAKAILEQYRKLDDQLATLVGPGGSVDYDQFRDGVNDKLDRSQTRRPVKHLLWRVLLPLSAAAVFLFVALPWLQLHYVRVVEVKTGGPVAISNDIPRVVQINTTVLVAEASPVVNITIAQNEVRLDSSPVMQDNSIICFATSLPESNSVEIAYQPIIEELYL